MNYSSFNNLPLYIITTILSFDENGSIWSNFLVLNRKFSNHIIAQRKKFENQFPYYHVITPCGNNLTEIESDSQESDSSSDECLVSLHISATFKNLNDLREYLLEDLWFENSKTLACISKERGLPIEKLGYKSKGEGKQLDPNTRVIEFPSRERTEEKKDYISKHLEKIKQQKNGSWVFATRLHLANECCCQIAIWKTSDIVPRITEDEDNMFHEYENNLKT